MIFTMLLRTTNWTPLAFLASLPLAVLDAAETARALTGQAGPGEDPKAWFYAGLFSMAEPVEVAEYLLGHRLITTVLSADPAPESPGRSHLDFAPATRETIRRIRAAIAQLQPNMQPAAPEARP